MKTIVLLLFLALSGSALSKAIVPTYQPKPIIFEDDDGEEYIFYPPFEKFDDGSTKV